MQKILDKKEELIHKICEFNRDVAQREVYETLGLSEQTFYSWKKKNPKLFEAVLDGHAFSKIKKEFKELQAIHKTIQIMSE